MTNCTGPLTPGGLRQLGGRSTSQHHHTNSSGPGPSAHRAADRIQTRHSSIISGDSTLRIMTKKVPASEQVMHVIVPASDQVTSVRDKKVSAWDLMLHPGLVLTELHARMSTASAPQGRAGLSNTTQYCSSILNHAESNDRECAAGIHDALTDPKPLEAREWFSVFLLAVTGWNGKAPDIASIMLITLAVHGRCPAEIFLLFQRCSQT
jgi:hypothetical protein